MIEESKSELINFIKDHKEAIISHEQLNFVYKQTDLPIKLKILVLEELTITPQAIPGGRQGFILIVNDPHPSAKGGRMCTLYIAKEDDLDQIVCKGVVMED